MEISPEISCLQYYPITCSPEEEEDMAANCLMLLAQGGAQKIRNKTAIRKFSEMATSADISAGGGGEAAYLYECKTCNRTFSSFQALGGHRASHKKPKLLTDNPTGASKKDIQPSPPSPSIISTPAQVNPEKTPKMHECSICGAEFSSGQALGGHMRRHRPVVPARNAAPESLENHDINAGGSSNDKNNGSVSRACLDLNLPAPPEEEDEEANNANSKFEFSAKQQSLVFSAPPLVDCHY